MERYYILSSYELTTFFVVLVSNNLFPGTQNVLPKVNSKSGQRQVKTPPSKTAIKQTTYQPNFSDPLTLSKQVISIQENMFSK